MSFPQGTAPMIREPAARMNADRVHRAHANCPDEYDCSARRSRFALKQSR
jgi:hypothetical protein